MSEEADVSAQDLNDSLESLSETVGNVVREREETERLLARQSEKLLELERHQAEAAKAIHELRSALTAAAVEIHFQHRVGISSMNECMEARCQEWCALLDRTSSGARQRAREGTSPP